MPEAGPQAVVVSAALEADAAALAALHADVARDLTDRFGTGHWSAAPSERAILSAIRSTRVLAGRLDGVIVATLQLQTRKPWAIDRSYFTDVKTPLYLVSMAVTPGMQRRGIGRRLLDVADDAARAWPAGAIRLDAYDADAGAGPFYARCGYQEVGRASYRGTPHIYFEKLIQATR